MARDPGINGLGDNIPKDVLEALQAKIKDLIAQHPELSLSLNDFTPHHVMAQSVMRDSDFISEVYGADNYRAHFNSLDNLVLLPNTDEAAKVVGMTRHVDGDNHPSLRREENRIQDDLWKKYKDELSFRGLDVEKPEHQAAIEAVKEKYRTIHDRLEFKLKEGLVSAFDPNDLSKFTPEYVLSKRDGFVNSAEMTWEDLRTRQFESFKIEALLGSDPDFQFGENLINGKFEPAVSDDIFDVRKKALVDTGIFDPGTLGKQGHALSALERALARRDEGAEKLAASLGSSVDDLLHRLNGYDLVKATTRLGRMTPEIAEALSKVGHAATKGPPNIFSIIAVGALLAAGTKKAYAAEYAAGAETTTEATDNLVEDFGKFLDSIKAEDASEVLLNFVVETEQKARVAFTGGVEGVALVVTDFTLGNIQGFIDVFHAFRVLFDENEGLKAMEPMVDQLEKILNTVQRGINSAIKGLDKRLGNDIPEVFVGSGTMRIDRESGALDNGKVQYAVGLDNAKIFTGKGDDVVIHFGSGEVRGGEGDDVLVGWFPDAGDRRLTLNGGDGDDYLVVIGGEGAITIGGAGRDFLFNTSYKGQLYGDSIDGTGAHDSDVFWWSSGTFIMDAGKNDILQMYGIPLTGGTTCFGGGQVRDWIMPFFTYGMTKTGQLLVSRGNCDPSESEASLLSHSMVVQNYTSGGFDPNSDMWLPERGDLGMTFRITSFDERIGSGKPKLEGSFNKMMGIIWGELLARLEAITAFAKMVQWKPADDPLVLDLDGDGIETSSRDDSTAHFDLDGDYFAEKTSWVGSDDGLLVMDRDGNGAIDDISELFGAPGGSGFTELAKLDTNGDGRIDAGDADFLRLQVWRDLNQDGISGAGELFTLAELGITGISLQTTALDVETPSGNHLRAQATFDRADGSTGTVFEALFNTNPIDSRYRGDCGRAEWNCGVEGHGYGRLTDLSVAIANDLRVNKAVSDALAAMTVPDLAVLRAQVTPLLGAWAATQTTTRELTAVLTGTDDAGGALLDHAVYVEDAQGGYWRLDSGNPVLGGDGMGLDRTTARLAA